MGEYNESTNARMIGPDDTPQVNPANESEARPGRGLDATPIIKGQSNLTRNHIL